MSTLKDICSGLPLSPLPEKLNERDKSVPHAPVRTPNLTSQEQLTALQNALRYFPISLHEELALEFAAELKEYGHIYMYRFKPNIEMKAYPIDDYPCQTKQAAAVMLMIMNNLDPRVAQFPHELVTYGGNGHVFSNWAQFLLVMHYLSTMTEHQTLVMYSGHPMGLFPSSPRNPRVVITNGMVIPNYSSILHFERMFALGVTMYGQMTAGSYCYIGPQGIVHGTTITVMNAGRKYLKTNDLSGKVFVTSGLGGMSGAQPKAGVICGCVAVVAEDICVRILLGEHVISSSENNSLVSKEALLKRKRQGWVLETTSDCDELIQRIKDARTNKLAISIGYHGNIVEVWEHLAKHYEMTGERLVDLGSDQTSLHNPFNGGYYPVQEDMPFNRGLTNENPSQVLSIGELNRKLSISFEEANEMMHSNPQRFKKLVNESLCRQVIAINKLSEAGMYFWDYGNAFLLQASRAGAEVKKTGAPQGVFKYPTYVQDIMGDIFSMGFGPFRWVCSSGLDSDLEETDKIAEETLKRLSSDNKIPEWIIGQYRDNLKWIQEAGKHNVGPTDLEKFASHKEESIVVVRTNENKVVGSKARILYCDQKGRSAIAQAFNESIKTGKLKGPVILSRDHHDVSGTDSPFRETSNIFDGSSFCADMAIQNCIGDSFRGATWVAIHNGGGCGWGEVINGGFGLVLDGSEASDTRAREMLAWDVSNGVARRAWCGNEYAKDAITRTMQENPSLVITPSYQVSDKTLLTKAFSS